MKTLQVPFNLRVSGTVSWQKRSRWNCMCHDAGVLAYTLASWQGFRIIMLFSVTTHEFNMKVLRRDNNRKRDGIITPSIMNCFQESYLWPTDNNTKFFKKVLFWLWIAFKNRIFDLLITTFSDFPKTWTGLWIAFKNRIFDLLITTPLRQTFPMMWLWIAFKNRIFDLLITTGYE